MSRVIMGISGGVDSAVAALTLRDEGREVRGVWLCMTPDQDGEAGARAVCDRLGIPLDVLDLAARFQGQVLGPVAESYRNGRTPNPCVLCNPTVKLAALAASADALGIEHVATGHYVRVQRTREGPILLRGADPAKDQSYFLSMVPPEILARMLFPLGEGDKRETRALARAAELAVADAPESQETCFAGSDRLGDFLEMTCGLVPRPGPVVLEDGREIGRHRGLHRFTVGQRRGLGIPWQHPLHVLRLEPDEDRLVVGRREALDAAGLVAKGVRWGCRGIPAAGTAAAVKIRYRSPAAPCRIVDADGQGFRVSFDKPLAAVTPGQAAVLYDGETVVGAGWIEGAE